VGLETHKRVVVTTNLPLKFILCLSKLIEKKEEIFRFTPYLAEKWDSGELCQVYASVDLK
jgi:hypothetical protein